MALYHFHVTQIKRSAGQSVTAAAAYRAGEKLHSEYYGTDNDYTRKSGVVHTEILLPDHAPREYADRQTLWDAVENAEHGKKAQLAYSFDIALQNEFSTEENVALARRFVLEQFTARGMIADLAVHMPEKDGGIENPHFHVLCPIRPINPDGTWGAKQRREYLFHDDGTPVLDDAGHQKFNAVPTTDWGRPETLESWRQAWSEMCNQMFAEKGLTQEIDHRSYARQGVDIIPTVHEGPNVRQMEARGMETDKGKLNRWIRKTRRMIADLKAGIRVLLEALAEIRSEMKKFDTENIAVLLNTYYDRRNAGAYSKKARAGNFKEQVEAFNYLQARKINTIDELRDAVSSLSDRVSERQKTLRNIEARMKELAQLIRYADDDKRLKPLIDEMNAIRWPKKREAFRQEHEREIKRYYLAHRKLGEHADRNKIPLSDWRKELAACQTEHDAEYEKLKADREEFRKLHRIKGRLESALRPEREHSRERTER